VDKVFGMIFRVALDAPLRRVFDYLAPSADDGPPPPPGVRVRVPFGRRQLVGILTGTVAESPVPAAKLRPVLEVLDAEPVFDPATWQILNWAAEYYHHPIGEVYAAALPVALREGQSASVWEERWELTPEGRREHASPGTRRAPAQRALLARLAAGPTDAAELLGEFKRLQLRAVESKGWALYRRMAPASARIEISAGDVELTAAQAGAVAAITASLPRFAAHLLQGVTGSGKTEVYLRAIAAAIERGGQALVLVPEIALTPQLVERFRRRFSAGVAVLHSGLPGGERRDGWREAHAGTAHIVIGTRSAVFTSMPRLALVIVDEEHDASYKQHEGFRYSARDLAVLRAQRAGVPVVLGSATPSLESLDNVAQARYSRLVLPERPGAARAPRMSLIDLKRHACDQGVSQPALQAIGSHLAGGGQVIVYLNRRGFAPTLFCSHCGWVAPCAHCDARMTVHRRAGELRCHHCGARGPVPALCGACGQSLNPVGQGTERVEETLQRLFPQAALARLDRDTAAGRGEMEAVLARVHSGAARILVGTQMLTKGHDFPEVSLVVILAADQGLFASDYRATERLAQTIIQVAGRAGRAARAGEVLIQTEFPEHPLLRELIEGGYERFASGALEERRAASWPPFSRLALLRAEARDAGRLDEFLRTAAALARPGADGVVKVLGPAPALIARKADHFRAHLLIESPERPVLQRFLADWLTRLDQLALPAGLRWSLDVDPLEVD
jgi:primosomal protein N' (replication factor Y)